MNVQKIKEYLKESEIKSSALKTQTLEEYKKEELIIVNTANNNEDYNNYINTHCKNVKRCFEEKFVPYCNLSLDEIIELREQLSYHDESKWSIEEYQPYCDRFYPDGTKNEEEIRTAFAYAWLNHLHKNPHHPQHWLLTNDTDHNDDRALDMPFNYIVEMLCDWGSFYYMNEEKKPGINPNSRAHDWWEQHRDDLEPNMSQNTIDRVNELLEMCPEI